MAAMSVLLTLAVSCTQEMIQMQAVRALCLKVIIHLADWVAFEVVIQLAYTPERWYYSLVSVVVLVI